MRVLPFFLCAAVFGASLPDILNQELQRNFKILKEKAKPAPYFIAYAVEDAQVEAINATAGVVSAKAGNRQRTLTVTVRVGDRKFDNYHMIDGERPRFTRAAPIPLDDLAAPIQRVAWLETDRCWRAGAERYTQVKSRAQTAAASEDDSDDFSVEEPAVYNQPPPQLRFSADAWTPRLKKVSAELAHSPDVLNSDVSLVTERETRYLITTDGARIVHGATTARLVMICRGKAADGMDLETDRTFEATSPDKLPNVETLVSAAAGVRGDLSNLISAPYTDPYVGPAILSGRAAGVFFHEIFGHRVEGQRQKDQAEGQTFTRSVGQPVLPPFLSVVFDPTRRDYDGTDLSGWYEYDDQGVKARPVTVVDKGILRTFLMSRTPIKGFDHSNGHGRAQAGLEPVGRQSNLIVESSKSVSDRELRKMLIDEIKRQNKPYGLYFRDITGGRTQTGRGGLQAFTVIPQVVYRVYADGRPDQLVRGVDIVGTPLASFAKIMATSDHAEVFNGICGAESGSVPVSAISPALLISDIEVQKKERGRDRPPFLQPPVGAAR
ncbi:MAG TPA: metallopeptidase TldD-related protein [Bryobacteraceae bacterium]|nr:metallopeptidase TldD-related protein [Bryobacteraceae bacterium]